MERIIVAGGWPLHGAVEIHGAKNAALPIIAACLLSKQGSVLQNLPDLTDIHVMREILHSFGAVTAQKDGELTIEAPSIDAPTIPEHLMREMRSSIILMGPLIARCGRVSASYPGGCAIGSRPIDLHLKGLREMGVTIVEEGRGYIVAEAKHLRGADIHLDFPSVGATENLMMAGVLADGHTVIRNAAKEPEVVDLQNFLISMGAIIEGAGSDCIKITGVEELKGTKYRIIPDRIAAGTYLLAGIMTQGEVTVYPVVPDHMEPFLAKFREMGVRVATSLDSVTVSCPTRPSAVDMVRTLPHPGFPTDLQAPMLAALCLAQGSSIVSETVFESRFKHVDELRRMGASIKVEGRAAIVRGVETLKGAIVSATDLRAGAALVIAGLAAEGVTVIEMIHHIDRGYVKLDHDLRTLGARIERLGW